MQQALVMELTQSQGELADAMGRAARTYDRIGPRFFADIAGRLVSRVEVRHLRSVLDVGTGPGVVLAEIARVLDEDTRLVGIDFSARMIDEARRRLRELGRPDAEFLLMDAERLEFPNSTFDAIFCSSALYQLPHPERAVKGAYRTLLPGGVLAISIFGDDDPRWDGKNELFAKFAPPQPRIGSGVGEAGLRSLLVGAGFEDVCVEPEPLDVVFRDASSWLETAWSHGERRALDAMDAAARDAFRKALPAALEPARESDGALHWRPELIVAVALKNEQATADR